MFANSLSHPREARRTFGFVGAVGILGGLFGGLLAPSLSAWTPGALVLVAALLVAVVALVVPALGAEAPSGEVAPRGEEGASPPGAPWARVRSLVGADDAERGGHRPRRLPVQGRASAPLPRRLCPGLGARPLLLRRQPGRPRRPVVSHPGTDPQARRRLVGRAAAGGARPGRRPHDRPAGPRLRPAHSALGPGTPLLGQPRGR